MAFIWVKRNLCCCCLDVEQNDNAIRDEPKIAGQENNARVIDQQPKIVDQPNGRMVQQPMKIDANKG